MRMNIKHLTSRDGVYYYQRSVPKDLIEHYGKRLIVLKLVGDNLSLLKKQCEELGRRHSAEFRKLRNNPINAVDAALTAKARTMVDVKNVSDGIGIKEVIEDLTTLVLNLTIHGRH